LQKNIFVIFELVKWNLTMVGPPGKMLYGHHLEKPTVALPPLEKILPILE